MMKGLFSRRGAARSGLLATALTVVAASPAMAGTWSATPQTLGATALPILQSTASSDTSSCSVPSFFQAFLGYKDNNWYTLAPGQSPDDFSGTGWTLAGGATITTTRLADGGTGSVLDLPSGGVAVSPPMCVASDYPTARSMVESSKGAAVSVGVAYPGAKPQMAGTLQSPPSGWALSAPLQVHPGNLPGWRMVQFVFGATGSGGDARVYDFYVDPRMSR